MEPVSAHVSGIIPACAGNTTRGPAASSPARDHPRVCGEHVKPGDDASPLKGSSPRVRGTLRQFRDPIDVRGIIPACAGNTQSLLKMLPAIRDHPRVCGEHVYYGFSVVLGVGSSPRVRGTHGRIPRRHRCHGIIPACAGNTFSRNYWFVRARDHPRVCGEHPLPAGFSPASTGSSPRVRGTLLLVLLGVLECGIIPACAGNTPCSKTSACRSWDHPRVCGEHFRGRRRRHHGRGSSPRVRGTPAVPETLLHPAGIIPACAGNTISSKASWMARRDHPRVCGEHVITSANKAEASGSSPRVRGTLRIVRRFSTCQGIIPACAGNTGRSSCAAPGLGDHPRVCGEHK